MRASAVYMSALPLNPAFLLWGSGLWASASACGYLCTALVRVVCTMRISMLGEIRPAQNVSSHG